MPGPSRRRFLAISAAALGCAAGPGLAAAPLHRWRGTAMGAAASITLRHPEAEALTQALRAEIDRLEDIFSLHRSGSALARLNAEGALEAPPLELVELLGLCGSLHAATAGRFDPTVQPLWAAHAEAHARHGRAPTAAELAGPRAATGWEGVSLSAGRIAFARPGMALTLNGIAQGYVADRVAARLAAEGLSEVLVDMGELSALGGHPDGGDWPVTLRAGEDDVGHVALRDMALASSAPRGTAFDAAGTAGHILDPATGSPTAAPWRLVSVTAPRAALADGLSTAACLMTGDEIVALLAGFPQARLVHLS